MTDNKNERQQYAVKKNIKGLFFVTFILALATLIFAFIRHGKLVNSMILSDYFFVMGIVHLILGALTRTFAWLVHKRSILKPRDENVADVEKAKLALKKISKLLSVVGAINIILSLIFVAIYYYI